jgi:hypothetical protein
MFGRISLWVVLGAVLLAFSLNASRASAQVGIGPGAYGLGFFNYGAYGNGSYYRVPYYALFPPVYYSYPVARPYGYSPFAYPPGTITPEIPQKSAAVEFRNPFVPDRAKVSEDKTASAPRMYLNPFVKQAATASTLAAARPDGT